MALSRLLMVMMAVAVATGANFDSDENELDYSFWNYREGADSVNVASVPSVTRVLDAWGKQIFKQIKTALHSEPSTLLPDYSRVRHLSEYLNDLFREVSLLNMRITELSQRLKSMEPFLRHYGYQERDEREEDARVGEALSSTGWMRNLTQTQERRDSGSTEREQAGEERTGKDLRRNSIN